MQEIDRKLVINRDDTFKPAVKGEIDNEDFFAEYYKRACEILGDLLEMPNDDSNNNKESNQKKSEKKVITKFDNEYKNNIIAFCGERGYGKTSAMLTFAYSVYNHSKNGEYIKIDNISDKIEKIEKTFFEEPIIIDPTMFDESHNIIDIVLAKLYRKFIDKSEKGLRERDEKDNYYARQELLNCFEKVYSCVSLIADPSKVKEHEYDYDGNIGKLSKLGESTRLKEYLEDLIDLYLRFMDNDGSCSKDNKRKLIIAIDDLDLCNENAYKLSEQIRKYLIIPNVIIIMAVRIDQLKLGVMEHNFANFKKLSKYKNDSLDIFRQVHTMSEKYITKLIPQNNRICIHNMRLNKDAKIEYKGKLSDAKIVDDTLNRIREKTGMIFVKDEYGDSYLISNSIREFVDFYFMLIEVLQSVDGGNRYGIIKSNIRIFYEYYKSVFIDSVQPSIKRGLDFVTENDNNIHFKSIYFLLNQKYDKIDLTCKEDIKKIFDKGMNNEKKNTFSDVLKVLSIIEDRVNTEEVKKCANIIKVIYTAYLTAYREGIEINDRNKEIQYRKFIGDYIWGVMINDVVTDNPSKFPVSRFNITIKTLVDVIVGFEEWPDEDESEDNNDILDESDIKYAFEYCGFDNICQQNKITKEYSAQMIPEEDEDFKKECILCWVLVGLFVDTSNKTIIANNSIIDSNLHISIENYIYGLSDLIGLYDKLNLSAIGCEKKDFITVVNSIKERNGESIKCARYISSSMDVMLDLLKYCEEHRNPGVKRDACSKKANFSYGVIFEFINNIEKYMKDKLNFEFKKESFYELNVDSKFETFDIPDLYSKMLYKLNVPLTNINNESGDESCKN